MKINSTVFTIIAISLVGIASYYIGVSNQKGNPHQQATPSNILPIVLKQADAVETAASESQNFKNVLESAQKGDPNAQSQLGMMYGNGKGVTQNSQEAVKWYTKAAEQGNAKAQCRLGFMYENGGYVIQDYQEAFKWYARAAEQGDTGGQFALGKMYADGKGVIRDDQEAIKWYTKAAEQGDKEGQVVLSTIYGLSQDYVEAYKWIILAGAQATAQSDLYIFEYRDKLKDRMSPQQIDEAQRLAKEFKPKINNTMLKADEIADQEQSVASNSSPAVTKQTEVIEAEYERKKQEIEVYYANEFRKLQQKVDITLKKYDTISRGAYAQFNEQLKNTISTSYGYTSVYGYASPYGNVSASGWENGRTHTYVAGNPASDYWEQMGEFNKALDEIMDGYEAEYEKLRKQKTLDLDQLEKRKKLAIAGNYTPAPDTISSQNTKGVVTGILSSEDNPSAVINGEIVYEGSYIGDIKVVSISKEGAEFEKNGKRWKQQVSEPPNPAWQE